MSLPTHRRPPQLLACCAVAFVVVVALVWAGRGYRDFWVSYDLLPDYENAVALVEQGRLPVKGSRSGLGADNPPGLAWVYAPGVWLFPREPGLSHAVGSGLLFAATVVALTRLLLPDLGAGLTVFTVGLFASSSLGMFYASSLWPRAHVCFYAWTVYYLRRWALDRRPSACAAALAAYLAGLYCFLEIAPLGLVFPVLFLRHRPPVGRTALAICALAMTLLWWPYLSYQVGRGGADLRTFVSGHVLVDEAAPAAAPPTEPAAHRWTAALRAAAFGNVSRAVRPVVATLSWLAIVIGVCFAHGGARRRLARVLVPGTVLPAAALRLHELLAVSLVVPWAVTWLLVSRESLDPSRRFWWLWVLQVYFIAFTGWWLAPRIQARRWLRLLIPAVLTLAVLPLGLIKHGILQWRLDGYAGPGHRRSAVDRVAALITAEGRSAARIGYQLSVPAWQRRPDGRFIFKVGNDYDLVFRQRHRISNLGSFDIGFQSDDEFRIVEERGVDAWRELPLVAPDSARFVEIGRFGQYWVGRRRADLPEDGVGPPPAPQGARP